MQISFAAAVASSVLLLCIAPLLLSHLIYVCSFKRFLSTHKEQTHSGTQSLHFCVNCSHRRRWLALHNHSRVVIHSLLCCCCVSVFIAGECIFCCCWCCCARSTLPRDCIDWMAAAAAAAVCACTCQRRGPQRMRELLNGKRWQSLYVFAAAAAFAPY